MHGRGDKSRASDCSCWLEEKKIGSFFIIVWRQKEARVWARWLWLETFRGGTLRCVSLCLPPIRNERESRDSKFASSSVIIIIIYNSTPFKKALRAEWQACRREGKNIPMAPVAVRYSFPSRACGNDISFRWFKAERRKKERKKKRKRENALSVWVVCFFECVWEAERGDTGWC